VPSASQEDLEGRQEEGGQASHLALEDQASQEGLRAHQEILEDHGQHQDPRDHLLASLANLALLLIWTAVPINSSSNAGYQ